MKAGPETPLRCPLCRRDLQDVIVRNLGRVTARLPWQLHAGRCPEHGWFQAEVISRPPREIFPVNRPGGIARRILLEGKEIYSFPTIWARLDTRQEVDPFDARFWAVDWERLGVRPPAARATEEVGEPFERSAVRA
ncbi:MAG: hypothetical protein NZL87_03600 [Thermomicrobium sp.]|nr:hypothetical protein [Thermomicrobium sp.]MDW7982584.1 hypothetical protein [Thermomicrobium sp.]